ncbi:hypothetical protein [Bacillus sp. UMB0728]|nr:hypothetical protein [Bacillus sp. UMB0728]
MTVRELINLLLDCEMDAEIKVGSVGNFGDEIKGIKCDELERGYAIEIDE